MLAALFFAAGLAVASPAPQPTPTLTPDRILGLIRATFRSHRPPPPYETYTLVRSQLATNGYPDYAESYTYHIWCRTSDRAALGRRVFMDTARGPLEFMRPAFNEPRDPGPPTADVFEPAPAHPHSIDFVPTPEAVQTQPPVIGSVRAFVETDYRVTSVSVEGGELHLTLEPFRDPQRNRLREIFADAKTYELRKLIATDRLFDGKTIYPVTFTITMGSLDGVPIVTAVRGVVGGGYDGDGQVVDYQFEDVAFPPSLPAWYFDPHTYAAHANSDAPL